MRILISGYYGFGNAGDEAILAGTIDALRARLPHCEPVVLSAQPSATREAYGVHSEQRWHRPTVWREIGAADLVLQGGGGLIQDTTSRRSALYYLGILTAARVRRTPFVVLAQGVGPLEHWLTRSLTGKVFRRAGAISVRDEGSRALLAEIGVPEDRVIVTADLAALVGPSPPEDVAHLLPPRGDGPRVGLALREAPGSEALVEGAALAARRLRDAEGARTVPLALHARDDVELASRFAQELGARPIGVEAPLTPSEWVSLVGSLDFVIAVRLHACIFAATQGVPFVALSYDPKVCAFAESAGARCASPAASPEDVSRLVEAAWNEREPGAEPRDAFAIRLREAAERNIDLVEELVSQPGA